MEYKGIPLCRWPTPTGWKWTVQVPGNRPRSGSELSRALAIRFAEIAIDRAIAKQPMHRKDLRFPLATEQAKLEQRSCSLAVPQEDPMTQQRRRSNTRKPSKSGWRKRLNASKRRQIRCLPGLTANGFYSGPEKLIRPLTLTSG